MQDNSVLRLSIFFGVLLLMMILEALFPRKKRNQKRLHRWPTNIGLAVINTLSVRLLGALSAFTVANYAMHENWGLLSRYPLPLYMDIMLGIALLDLSIYLQHVLSHKIPLFWRLHRVHHSDRDLDVTSGIRFHPLEIVASALYKCMIVVILGPLPMAIIAFEVILNASAMFNHANIKIPTFLDTLIRAIFVTPDMHRVHHSSKVEETNSNYGFCLSLWDRLFGTYIRQPSAGHEHMDIGLAEWQTDMPSKLRWNLTLPFKKDT